MKRHEVVPGLAALGLGAALACVSPAVAARRAPVAKPVAAVERAELTPARDTLAASELRLRFAVTDFAYGNLHGVVEHLGEIDFASPTFAEADRAALLLGYALHELGAWEREAALADQVAKWSRKTPYTEGLARAARNASGGSSTVEPSAEAWLNSDLPLATWFQSGEDAHALEILAASDTTTVLGRELAGAAAIRRASQMLERGEDARAVLAAVPAGSSFAPRARHMAGLIDFERGDRERGQRVLLALAASDSGYAARREVLLALAGDALDEKRWGDARLAYGVVETDWQRNRDELARLEASGDFTELWASWRSGSDGTGVLAIDERPEREHASRLASAAADLTSNASVEAPNPQGLPSGTSLRWPVPPPSPTDWDALGVAETDARRAAYELKQTLRRRDRERERLEERKRYLGIGVARVALDRESLAASTARLDSLRSRLDEWDAQLRGVRDAATARVAARTAALLERAADHELWMRAMRHFHLDGPQRERPRRDSGGLPGPDTVLVAEESLLHAVRALATLMAAETPQRIANSYEQRWRPHLIDRATTLGGEAGRALAWASSLSSALDSSLAGSNSSPALLALDTRAAQLRHEADSMTTALATLRDRIARVAIASAQAALDQEREGIDYGLAVSAYASSVRPDRAVPRAIAGAANGGAAGEVGAQAVDSLALENPATVLERERAIESVQAFLSTHPTSEARGEMRFRLADLLMVRARQEFQVQMAQRVAGGTQASGPSSSLPVLDYRPALDLYRAILTEDPEFPHRDAVLFNAGMILADEGDPEAVRLLGELAAAHPTSAYVQEARIRMGDLEFQERGFGGAITQYEAAALGQDPGLRAVARYKLGWAHFNQERFLEAADAFRGVLDLYAGAYRARIQVDVEREAEADLVQSLARAGGAETFADYFDRIGARPYEKRVLLALGQHFRRYSLYTEAARVDALGLERYPLEPEALLSAQRLLETHQRWDRAELARQAQLEYGPRFAPGSDWFVAQASDSLRAAGSEFARTSLLAVATHHHRQGREHDARTDWQEALRLYEQVISQWPADAATPELELGAGETSARLGEHARALAHYAAAARSSSDSIAAEGRWQRVVVVDAWYESSRAASPGARGGDSLARAVLAEGDTLLSRYPEHGQAANLLWRQGNLAFAHEWFDRAATAFDRLVAQHPKDTRAPDAATLRADALFRIGDFEAAGAAFESALATARGAGRDSLARRAETAIPVCYFRHAERVAEQDSTNHVRQAESFARVAERWPAYENAPVAQYRAGLAWLRTDRPREGIQAMESLIANFPRSEYVRDARLQISQTWEALGERDRAAAAFLAFAEAYPDDESARPAWLRAGDLLEAAGLQQRADDLRLGYIRRYPDDHEAAMDILEGLARRELAQVGPERPISTLLLSGRRPAGAARSSSHVAEYLQRAKEHPDLVSQSLVAQVRFLEGEEASVAFTAASLRQPLEASITAKQKLLDDVLVRYRESIDLGASEWANASAFRIGQTLIGFGEALMASERPADLSGDDLRGYEDVLSEQAQAFYDRGEEVWEELLRQRKDDAPRDPVASKDETQPQATDPWLAQAQSALWLRLGARFAYRPEMEFPVVKGDAPEKVRPAKKNGRSRAARSDAERDTADVRAQGEGGSR